MFITEKRSISEKKYRAIVGLNYGKPERRVEAGEIVDDLPSTAIKPLLKRNAIEEVEVN